MRTFDQLSRGERELAVARAEWLLVAHMFEGVIEIKLSNRLHQLDLTNTLEDCRRSEFSVNQTFIVLKRHEDIKKEIERIGLAAAEGSYYDIEGNNIMDLH